MKPGKRSDRVAEAIREELSRVILGQLKDPRIGFITITRVSVTDDLKYAKVYFSVLGSILERKSTQAALEHSTGFLEHSLKEVLTMRAVPKLSFKFDSSIEESIAMGSIFDKIHKENAPKNTQDEPETESN